MKVLEALCVTSVEVKRKQITFDEVSGLIVSFDDVKLPQDKVDYFYDDSCVLFAGMGDVHIHAREDVSGKNNYKEDFTSARSALHHGGLCHAGDMPNNPIPPVDDKSYEDKFKFALKAEGELWLYAGIGPETRPLSYAVPYKVYMGPSVGELYFKDLPTLDSTLVHYKKQVVSFHCEDPVILESTRNEPHHHERRPVSAEVVATKDALSLIEKYELKGKLCHYSSGEGLNLIRKSRKRGVKVAIEVTPQHLFFDIDQLKVEDYQRYQMNPPIRYPHDRKVLMEAVKNGEIDYLATDHAPHTDAEKKQGTSGLTGLDTYGPFVTWLLSEGVRPEIVARMVSENPGDFFNQFLTSWKKISPVFDSMGKGVGYLLPGYRANFSVLNLTRPLTIKKEDLKTKAAHSPFLNVTFPGQVEALFIGGKKV
ncbi:MAG: amidohydrolase [Bacteriovoracia bacterium]